MAEGRQEEECLSFGELRLCVITWNIANNDISTEDVETLVRHSFLVSNCRNGVIFVVDLFPYFSVL